MSSNRTAHLLERYQKLRKPAVPATATATVTTASSSLPFVHTKAASDALAANGQHSGAVGDQPVTTATAARPLLADLPPSFMSSKAAVLKYRDPQKDPLAAATTSSVVVRMLERMLQRHTTLGTGVQQPAPSCTALPATCTKRLREDEAEPQPSSPESDDDSHAEGTAPPLATTEEESLIDKIATFMLSAGYGNGDAPSVTDENHSGGDEKPFPTLYQCSGYWDACRRARFDCSGHARPRCADVKEYHRQSCLSHGVYGVVYSMYHVNAVTGTRKLFALKRIRKKWLEDWQNGFPLYLLREFELLLRLRHPNIVSAKELVLLNPISAPGTAVAAEPAESDKEASPSAESTHLDTSIGIRASKEVFLVMEHCQQDLKAYMTSYSSKGYPYLHVSTRHVNHGFVHWNFLSRVKCIMYQLFNALAFLHAHRILHRDIKTSNLLIDGQGFVKICDFGLGRQYREGKVLTPKVITLMYRAPELHLGVQDYTHAVDVWSMGCVMAELFLRQPLFVASRDDQLLLAICDVIGMPTDATFPGVYKLTRAREALRAMGRWNSSNKLAEVFASSSCPEARTLPPSGLELLQKIFSWCPLNRPSAAEVLRHPFFFEAPLPCDPSELMRPMPEVATPSTAAVSAVDSLDAAYQPESAPPRGSTTSVPPALVRVPADSNPLGHTAVPLPSEL